jgi:hypothetical protein
MKGLCKKIHHNISIAFNATCEGKDRHERAAKHLNKLRKQAERAVSHLYHVRTWLTPVLWDVKFLSSIISASSTRFSYLVKVGELHFCFIRCSPFWDNNFISIWNPYRTKKIIISNSNIHAAIISGVVVELRDSSYILWRIKLITKIKTHQLKLKFLQFAWQNYLLYFHVVQSSTSVCG